MPSPPDGPAFIELFAGCARLSGALRQAGVRTAVPFELARGQQFDVCNPKMLAELEGAV